MGFFQALGSKIRNAAHLGSKVLSTAGSLAHKVGTIGGGILQAVNSVPGVGGIIQNAPILGTVNKGLGAAFSAANRLGGIADMGSAALSAAAGNDYNRAAKLAAAGGVAAYNAVKNRGIEK